MLEHCNAPSSLWAEAINTAVYLRNRVPTRSVKNMTPFEAWSGKKPSIGHIRTFGSLAYAHIDKAVRDHPNNLGKLGPKAHRCVLVGYSEQSKAYRLWDPIKKTVLESRDVRFIESRLGIPTDVGAEGADDELLPRLPLPDDIFRRGSAPPPSNAATSPAANSSPPLPAVSLLPALPSPPASPLLPPLIAPSINGVAPS